MDRKDRGTIIEWLPQKLGQKEGDVCQKQGVNATLALKLVQIEVVRSLYVGKYGKTNEGIIRPFLGHLYNRYMGRIGLKAP